jgi:hypothetical protein
VHFLSCGTVWFIVLCSEVVSCAGYLSLFCSCGMVQDDGVIASRDLVSVFFWFIVGLKALFGYFEVTTVLFHVKYGDLVQGKVVQ